jgi:hypothetical protein
MTDFWLACGHHLTERDSGGGLLVTDDFLKLYLARPELHPPPEACDAERALHAALLADPRRPVGGDEIAALADADARENWRVLTAFRDHLLRHRTLEAAYLALIGGNAGSTPPLFLDQLVQVILRNALDGNDDPFALRAAELFFRPQRMTLHNGALLAADEETIAGAAPPSPLAMMPGNPPLAEIDVMNDDNAGGYWARSDRFDMALDLSPGRRGAAALAGAIERWIWHMLSVEVVVEPLREMREMPLTWYVGLDAEGTRIGDALWRGDQLDGTAQGRIAALFRLIFAERDDVAPAFADDAVYLILAMTAERVLRVKPQNLLTGLPLGPASIA